MYFQPYSDSECWIQHIFYSIVSDALFPLEMFPKKRWSQQKSLHLSLFTISIPSPLLATLSCMYSFNQSSHLNTGLPLLLLGLTVSLTHTFFTNGSTTTSMSWPQVPSCNGHGGSQTYSKARGAKNLWVWTGCLWNFDLGTYNVRILASEGNLLVNLKN